ncbi:allophanate hydrolase [Jeotgalibacillus sp. S-D1]|uniref:allophanate hydrolase n=1 Tax=Jeotgalibacillus sp. S-D1 TaxID=2552189 RepID=UPI00105924E8|nr:allophanate hydrolase [Jeotgalibacillus sp. S-D1]TDL31111.1 allophanate hydrolase [Jeotgalibacillus sp. S-D1]
MKKIPWNLTIDWLQENYQKQNVTPREVLNEIIERSKRDESMNIWITAPSWEWMESYVERLAFIDPSHAPLWGVPFAIKDNIDLKNIPTTAGCMDYAHTPAEHATIVDRLIQAGAIPVGKTNLDQFATGLVGTRSPYGETHNSIREEMISGGSSSGSAVAVARGQAAFSLGTDTAGSGRVPAALNNLVGYKPSLGAWSKKGVVPACESIDSVSVFAHTLSDALAVDEQARAKDLSDPWSREFPSSDTSHLRKYCLSKEPVDFYGRYGLDYKKAWETAVEKLKSLNVPVEYVDTNLFEQAAEVLYGGPWISERWSALGSFVDSNPNAVHPVTEQVLRSGGPGKYDAAVLFDAIHQLQSLKREAEELLRDCVLVMPTCGGTWSREEVRNDPVATNTDMGRYTNHCNLLDLAAVATPAGEAADGIPFGVSFFSLSDQEEILVQAADLFLNSYSTHPIPDTGEDSIPFAVCGLHMRGYPLEKQMIECGAEFIKEEKTAQSYQLIKLPGDPSKPGLIKQSHGGTSIVVELWKMPLKSLGQFIAAIPAPLGVGKVELHDGSEVTGFISEGYAEQQAEDISTLGGWRQLQGIKVK